MNLMLNSRDLAKRICKELSSKKAEDIVFIDVTKSSNFTDYLVICTAKNQVHAKVLSDHILEELRKEGIKPFGVEGERTAEWILVDLIDVVLHIFCKEAREYYRIEEIWFDAPQETYEEASQVGK